MEFNNIKKQEVKTKYVRIRFLDTHKFSEVEVPVYIKKGDFIVVESEKGEEVVLVLGNTVPQEQKVKFKRKANKKDIEQFDKNEEEAKKYFEICKELAEKFGLKMNLLKSYIPLDKSKVFFYYTAESRVDFRELVKELAKRIKTRIQMMQVGVRDGVQLAGAVGICGHQCCCNLFLDKFDTVSVEMLEEQNLPPTPAKFTGICGRLMCCLAFEKDNYSIRNNLPEIGSVVSIEGKNLTVKSYDFIKEEVVFIDEEGNNISYSFDYLESLGINRESGCSNCSGCQTKNSFVEIINEH
ncbi:stage 0 sporulation family protein [Venenivibrio stagnispumantis]|uniref:Cell fate regulator YaaT, PSP1 superfamily (Controls sporulation, competence, biofilm development) n=1 Tax=Venenivibrio stagnispumantis TaxID=407998 RepID=A0AA45WND0_9AQUI|nr:regulatory iron-sulfur-containing complex subunit RicT [Venenivibrio stagnispumantis]MCW4573179.1 regulatory iron-sulfur-containing complex subunit RicT [Venenivibrio stagnispumantis]SMP17786.1 Cell fate regulator YaaT, PSP1 superfamily (controls sporulation, competence, biofilm development) [Venenivibrio stagnispumantis]